VIVGLCDAMSGAIDFRQAMTMPFDVTIEILDARAKALERGSKSRPVESSERPFVRKDGSIDPPGITALKRMFGAQG
jgi:hypothetical protein